MAYCRKCGTQLSDGDNFCPKCGNPLDGVNTEDVGNDTIDSLEDTPKSSPGKYLLIGIIALILIGGGWYGYQFYSDKGNGLVTDSTQLVEGATSNDTERDNQLIREWYQLVFNGSPSDSDLDKYLAPNVKEEIWTDDYESCYEYYRFRTAAQDSKPGSDVSRIESITSKGDGWYEVKYLDMGWEGTTMVKVKDGKIVDLKADKTWDSWDNEVEPDEINPGERFYSFLESGSYVWEAPVPHGELKGNIDALFFVPVNKTVGKVSLVSFNRDFTSFSLRWSGNGSYTISDNVVQFTVKNPIRNISEGDNDEWSESYMLIIENDGDGVRLISEKSKQTFIQKSKHIDNPMTKYK